LLWEADLPNHVENAAGFEAAKIDALLCHASQQVTTMGIDSGRQDDPAPDADVESFAAKVHHQLAAHGALATLPVGEAFHLMGDL
jgi:N-acyl-D-aspartate/D-glutamate deacylase